MRARALRALELFG
ncbi:MAG: hypothetical protein OSP8Acid_02000 [uncultured Acidilobus sp. OSP8]|nr:MAG: hypothetical protein OSP8Acid_02000 [uncultured Acidilobus sp. OSP8]